MGTRKPIIGLCGGIGAGKSQVAAEFARQGCLVVDSDKLNHEILECPEVAARLREWWGPEVLRPDGRPDRRRIAEIVFSDAAQKRRLEDLVYPLIAARREAMIRAAEKDPAVRAVILDSPLLFESNLDRLCDTIVYVHASPAKRLQRLRKSRNWGEAQLRQREQWHQPLAYKRSRSEFVIDNDGPPERLAPQVEEILEKLAARNAADS